MVQVHLQLIWTLSKKIWFVCFWLGLLLTQFLEPIYCLRYHWETFLEWQLFLQHLHLRCHKKSIGARLMSLKLDNRDKKKMTIIRNFIDFTIKSFEFDKYAGGPFVPTLNRLYFMETWLCNKVVDYAMKIFRSRCNIILYNIISSPNLDQNSTK